MTLDMTLDMTFDELGGRARRHTRERVVIGCTRCSAENTAAAATATATATTAAATATVHHRQRSQFPGRAAYHPSTPRGTVHHRHR